MAYASSTIGSVIDDVNRTYFLPSIQRPFVWKSPQVIALFDSLLKGYPISSFMFWSVEENNLAEVRCYKFFENYRPDAQNEITSTDGRSIILVLDGQQRLTSMLIGLRGTFMERSPSVHSNKAAAWKVKTLFIDLLKDPDGSDEEDEDNMGITYGLAFHERQPTNNARHYWLKVGSILNYQSEERLEGLVSKIQSEIHDRVDVDRRQLAEANLRQLHRIIWQDKAVNFYTELDQSPDRVLDIFVRANDGGTKLSKADLLMSMITSKWSSGSAREDILGFVDHINKRLGAPNKITKDFLLKVSLVVCDFDATYNVRNFTKEVIAKIESNWDHIKRTVENTFRLINRHGIVADNLGSLNAVLPITYYLYNTPDYDFRGSTEFERMNASAMHYWLLNSLLVGAFSGNSDQTIAITRNTIRDHLLAGERSFPSQGLFDAVAKNGRVAQVDSHATEKILDSIYKKPQTFLVLSLLYHGIDWSGSNWHIDHIIPQAHAQRNVLLGYNMPQYRIVEMEKAINRLGNLQLLRADENVEKGAMNFRSWITGRRVDFYDFHMIPERLDLCDILHLPEFVKEREKLIRNQLNKLLGRGQP